MGISNGSEDTNNKSFVIHSSSKPFIRTMDDDLKKIKSNPIGNDKAAAADLSSAFDSRRAGAPSKEIKQPSPFFGSKSISNPKPQLSPQSPPQSLSQPKAGFSQSGISDSAAKPISFVPKNLPIDTSVVEKKVEKEELKPEASPEFSEIKPKFEPKTELKAEVSEKPGKTVDSGLQNNQILGKPSLVENKLANEKKSEAVKISVSPFGLNSSGIKTPPDIKSGEEKKIPSLKSFVPFSKTAVSGSAEGFFKKTQSKERLVEDSEKLSPEARLAKQLSAGINGAAIETKESSATPQPASGNFFGSSKRSANADDSVDPTLPASLMLKNRKTIEDVIKEDSPVSFIRKIAKVFLVILAIAAIGAGIYYFFVLKKPPVAPPIVVSSKALVIGATEIIIKADLNTDLNNEIKLSFSDVKPAGIYRLTLKDKDGQNSLAIENFSKSLSIILPDAISGALDKNYNLIAFNYPEKNYLRLGLALEIKNPSDISNFAKNWEASMYKDVKPIFFGNLGAYEEGKQFSSNKRNDFDIRYLPLGVDNIALNYAIDADRKFLLIATSKDDIFKLIDNIIRKN